MTSGNFSTIALDEVIINRESRQRRELTGIEELEASLRQIGLINPIVVTHDGTLIAGERRLTAARRAGWDRIACQYAEDLDPLELHLIELEENTKRVDLSWQDQCRAVEEYHRLRQERDPDWSVEKTSEALGAAARTVYDKLSVAKELASGNKRIAEAPKFSVAKNIVVRDRERRAASVIAGVSAKPLVSPILNADFHEWASGYTGEKFNLIHCDFPYGINMQKSDQGGGAAHGTYEDSPDVYWSLLETLKGAMTNVVADSAHLVFWYSMEYYESTRQLLSAMGWRIDPFPLIWHKSDNVGILPDPQRGPRRVYETALFGHRGDRKVVQAVANAFSGPTVRSDHMSEKPEPMLRHFFRMIVDEHSSVLDPTCGSGSAIRAAKAAGARTFLGLERDPEFAASAARRFLNPDQ